jgi:hypothetical protein
MARMISEVYDAFRAAGVDEEKSRKAAEAIAGYEARFAKLDERLAEKFAHIEGRLTLIQWLLGFNLAISVAVMWKIFS